MNKLIKSEKGASSILIMLLLVVLVVFGVAALTTALSNVRLGQKVTDWNDKYYIAEGIANERYAFIDKAVHDAADESEFKRKLLSSNYEECANAVKDFNESIIKHIANLNFPVEISTNEENMNFTYESWKEGVGIRATLSMSHFDIDLSPIAWKEIQKEQQ